MIDEARVTDLHRLAMKIAHEAADAPSAADARAMYARAMENERAAADLLETAINIEPTRSILYRSAAALALRCEEFREAEKLIAKGLAGNPPDEIADELRDLLEHAHFERHLALENVTLSDDEFQFSVAGRGVAPGVVGEGFVSRLRVAQRVFLRIAQELLGGSSEDVRQRFRFFLVAAQSASFAVTIRLGQERQTVLTEYYNQTGRVIDEFIECVGAFQDNDEEEMMRRMPSEEYRRDMTQLMDQLAPDGKEVAMVAVGRRRNGEEKKAALTHRPEVMLGEPAATLDELRERVREPRVLEGQLLYANEMQKQPKIILVDAAGVRHPVLVDIVSMEDIVKPLWGKMVRAEVERKKPNERFPHLVRIFENR